MIHGKLKASSRAARKETAAKIKQQQEWGRSKQQISGIKV